MIDRGIDAAQNMNPRKVFWIVVWVVVAFVLLIASKSLVEMVSPDEIVGIQNPITGKITWYTSQGPKFQLFGSVMRYPKSFTFWFS